MSVSCSEPTFRPSGVTDHGKHTVLRDFSTLSRTCIFFLVTFLFSDLLASSLLFSDSTHLYFSICSSCPNFDLETSFDWIHFRCFVAMIKHKTASDEKRLHTCTSVRWCTQFSPLYSAPAPHECAHKCATSVPERLELDGEARPKPPTPRPRTRKTPKILHSPGGKLFGRNPGRS